MKLTAVPIALLLVLPTAPAVPAAAQPTAEGGPLAFAMAKLLADEGSFREALEAFEEAVTLTPGDPYVRAEYAEFLSRLAQLSRSPRYRHQQLQRAIEQAEAARQLAAEDVDILRVVGETYLAAAEFNPQDAGPLQQAIAAFEAIRKASPYALNERMTLGQIYGFLGEPARAAEVYREVVEVSPRDRRAYDRLAQALLASGESEEAEAVLREILAFDPEADDARIGLAELLAQKGETKAAVALLKEGSEEFLSQARTRQLLAVQLYLAGDLDAALAQLESPTGAEEEEPGQEGEESREAEPMGALRAMILSAQGRNEEAAAELRELLQADPANADVASTLARVLVRLGGEQEASEVLAATTRRLEESDAEAGQRLRFEWAELLLGAERWQPAVEVLQPLVESTVPRFRAGAGLMQAEALAQLDRVPEALAVLQETGPDDVASQAKKAEILLQAGRQTEAAPLLENLVASGEESAVVAAASVYQRLERYPQAVAALRPFVAENPRSPRALFLLGAAHERSDQRQEAVDTFRRLLDLEPDFTEALNYLGYMWAEHGENLEEAEQLVRRAVLVEPDNGAYVDSLGWVYYQMGRYEEALVHLERAVKLIPSDGTILEHLGDAYLALDREAEAREAYLKALELKDTDREQVRQKLARLADDAAANE